MSPPEPARYLLLNYMKMAARDLQGVADILLGHAERTGAAYMVMGGYSHSRVGQFLFGGVTRRLLTDCPVALLLAR